MSTNSRVTYTGDGSTDVYTVPFPYISREHVKVKINGTELIGNQREWLTSSSIQIRTTPAEDAVIEIYRETPIDERLVDFQNGAILTEAELDLAHKQVFYLAQESRDYYVSKLNQAIVNIGTGNGITTTDPTEIINQITTLLLVDDISGELLQRINDIDALGEEQIDLLNQLNDNAQAIAAETLARATALSDEAALRVAQIANLQDQIDSDISNLTALSDALTEEISDRIDAVQGLGNNLAQEILDRQDGDTALDTRIDAVVASVGDNAALIASETTARIDGDDILASQVSVVSAAANRVRTFYQDEEPEDAEEGDLWFDTDDDNQVYRYNGTAWEETDDARIADALAQITSEVSARVSGDAAIASDVTALTTRIGDAEADIISVSEAVTTEATARATAISGLQTEVDGNTAGIATNATAISDEASARASAFSSLTARMDDAGEGETRAGRDFAISMQTPERFSQGVSSANKDLHVDLTPANLVDTTFGRAYRATSMMYLGPSPAINVVPGDTVRLSFRVFVSQDGSTATSAFGMYVDRHQEDGTYDGQSYITGADVEEADGIVEISGDFVIPAGVFWLRPFLYGNINSGEDAEINWLSFSFRNESRMAAAEAAIISEASARVTADSAIASDVSAITTRVGDAESAIVTNATAISTESSARATAISGLQSEVDDNAAAIVSEASTRASADSSMASDITGLTTRVGDAEADIITNASAISTETSARTSQFNSLQASIDAEETAREAAVLSEQTARVSGDASLASDITALDSRMGDAESDIVTNAVAISTESGTRATQVGVLQSRIGDMPGQIIANPSFSQWENAAPDGYLSYSGTDDITKEESLVFAGQFAARQNPGDSDTAGLYTYVGVYNGLQNIRDHPKANRYRIAADVYLVSGSWDGAGLFLYWTTSGSGTYADTVEFTDLRSDLETGKWFTFEWIAETESDISSTDGILLYLMSNYFSPKAEKDIIWGGVRVEPLSEEDDSINALLVTESETRAAADGAISSDLTALTTRVGDAEAAVLANSTAISDESFARATAIAGVQTDVDANTAAVATNATAISDETTARSAAITALQSEVDDNRATITNEQSARVNGDSALSADITSLDVRMGDAESDITTVAAVAADAQGRANAMYALRLDVNGNISGFGLSNDGTESNFNIVSNNFRFVDPGNGITTPIAPFEIVGGIVRMINAEATKFKAVKAGSSRMVLIEELSDAFIWLGPSSETTPTAANADVALGTDGLIYVDGDPLGSLAVRSSVTQGAPVVDDTEYTPAASRITTQMGKITTASLESGSEVDVTVRFTLTELFGITPNMVLNNNTAGQPMDVYLRLYRDYDGTNGTRTLLDENPLRLSMPASTLITTTAHLFAAFEITDDAHGGGVHDYSVRVESETTSGNNPAAISFELRNTRTILRYLERQA
tara:strand:- start:13737 stop:18002 length:4266 start_codon:yes stop_codon:yes gene_type:complete